MAIERRCRHHRRAGTLEPKARDRRWVWMRHWREVATDEKRMIHPMGEKPFHPRGGNCYHHRKGGMSAAKDVEPAKDAKRELDERSFRRKGATCCHHPSVHRRRHHPSGLRLHRLRHHHGRRHHGRMPQGSQKTPPATALPLKGKYIWIA
jgi:hypothetical protein